LFIFLVPLIYDREAVEMAAAAKKLVGKEQRNLEFFDEFAEDNETNLDADYEKEPILERSPRAATDFILELGVFFDEAGYRLFRPFFNNDDNQIRDMLLAYMNAVSRSKTIYTAHFNNFDFFRFKRSTCTPAWGARCNYRSCAWICSLSNPPTCRIMGARGDNCWTRFARGMKNTIQRPTPTPATGTWVSTCRGKQ
jgi:hypothetical protein